MLADIIISSLRVSLGKVLKPNAKAIGRGLARFENEIKVALCKTWEKAKTSAFKSDGEQRAVAELTIQVVFGM